MASMRIALTGAAREPGRQILAELRRQDVDVRALLEPRAEPDAQGAGELAADACEVDLEDAAALTEALAGATHVVHAHALTEPGRSAADYEAANVATTTALLDACMKLSIAGFVLVSTTETYGWDLPPWPVGESWAPHPIGAQLQSRVTAEQAARTYRRSVPLAVLRAAPCLGAEPGAEAGMLRRVVGHFVSHPRAGLVAGGQTPLSIIAAADLARAVWAILADFDQAAHQVFHATSTHATWRELAEEGCRLRGVEPQFWNAPRPLARALDAASLSNWALPAPQGVDAYVALTGNPHLIDDSRLRIAVGYSPVLTLRGALTQALNG